MLDSPGAKRLFKQRQYTTLQPRRLTVHLTDLFLGSIGVPAIAGIAVSCVLLGILVTIVFVYLRKKAKARTTMQDSMDTTGQVKFDNNAENVGFSNPMYSTSDEPIKANPIYSSNDRLDNDDDDDNPDYTAPY